jgi:hypothetical protein
MAAARFHREGDRPWIVLFDSIHHVLAAERTLKERGFRHDLVPVPKDLSSDCGMAVEIRAADGDEVLDLLDGPGGRWRSVHRRTRGGWAEVASREKNGNG